MTTLLLTCAGTSQRFPGMAPKWTLQHPSGHMMAIESIRLLTGYERLVVAIREEQAVQYGRASITQAFWEAGHKAEVVCVPNTPNQVATVCAAVVGANVQGAFFVKDCDNVFPHDMAAGGNAVAVMDLHNVDRICPRSKSYVEMAPDGAIHAIAEKRIISNMFCVGGYGFAARDVFLNHLTPSAAYVSQVIQCALEAGQLFKGVLVTEYLDWGTAADWRDYMRSLEQQP